MAIHFNAFLEPLCEQEPQDWGDGAEGAEVVVCGIERPMSLRHNAIEELRAALDCWTI